MDEIALGALRQLASRFCPIRKDQNLLVAETLLLLPDGAGLLNPRELKRAIFGTMRGIIVGTAARRPTVLVVEDEYMIATKIALAFERTGVDVIGPVPTIEEALRLAASHRNLTGAVLDIRLGSDHVFPLADLLKGTGIPYVFLSGYDRAIVPKAHEQAPLFEKPCDLQILTKYFI